MQKEQLSKAGAPAVVLQCALVITLVVSFATGLQVAADAAGSSWAQAIRPILPQGTVSVWHVWAALALALLMAGCVTFIALERLRSRAAADASRRRGLLSPMRRTRLPVIDKLVYWTAFVLIMAAAVTGSLLYWAPGLLPHSLVSLVHRGIAWLIIGLVILHVFAQLAQGGFRRLLGIFLPRSGHGAALSGAVIASALIGALIYGLDKASMQSLRIAFVSHPPLIDGDWTDEVWKTADEAQIPTSRGANVKGGEIPLRLRMLHDNERIYVLFEWPDATRSQKHLPLVKTLEGWIVKQNKYHIEDEDDYYEDKLGVMLAQSSALAGAGTAHLGKQPLAGRPEAKGGRGLHYTTDGSIVDVWHWQSVRTGNPLMNQIDDSYFGPPLEPKPGAKRYTGGYAQDPASGRGGSKLNWEKDNAPGFITPLRLPKSPAVIEQFQGVDLDPQVSDDVVFMMPMDQTIPYSRKLDTYPIGTVMPSVLVNAPLAGDRGDVEAVGRWKDGWWHLEVSRKLDTGSKYDVALTKERPTYLWVAVFDHTQTRHTQHLRPVRLLME
ncbi:ethylbenzene dehydrogenase-related protein [Noviherbaspirillum aerium]|uniref:ethylbenzene dehydrogenase-related protein n=1 Tax=Noviherbaspirillum aerium TaxID=2588497 RepID=UPI00124EF7C5|nr:ethylbenzene dehydrogenase-related protein [Noviherbaspirillum aerium]